MYSCITDVDPTRQLFWTESCCLSSRTLHLTASIYVKKKGEGLPRPAHLGQRGRQEHRRHRKCLKAQETAVKLFPSPGATPSSPTSHTHHHLQHPSPPPTHTQTRTHWNIYHSVPVCWWPRLWIIYQQKCRNNLIEMKTHLLGIFFLHIKTDSVRSRCHLLFCILKARWLQLSTISIINEYFNPENRTALLFYPNIPQLTLCNAIIISIPAYMH